MPALLQVLKGKQQVAQSYSLVRRKNGTGAKSLTPAPRVPYTEWRESVWFTR